MFGALPRVDRHVPPFVSPSPVLTLISVLKKIWRSVVEEQWWYHDTET